MIFDLQMQGLMELLQFIYFRYRISTKFHSFPTIKDEFKFDGDVLNDINGYGPVLTNKLVSVGSDGQKHFILI